MKKQRWPFLASLLIGQSLSADCTKPFANDEIFRQPPQIIAKQEQLIWMQDHVYQSDLRLKNRFYQTERDQFSSLYQNKRIDIGSDFFNILSRHITQALELKSAEAISFSDMGHVHLYSKTQGKLSDLIKNKQIKFLYHSAELFSFTEDNLRHNSWLKERYFKRNMIGQDGQLSIVVAKSGFNTVRTIPGHKQIETLYFTANKNGCFSYRLRGETFFYDVTFAKPRF